MIKSYLPALALVFLWSCMDPLPPVPESTIDLVDDSREEMSEVVIMAPGEDPARRDSLVNDLIPFLLKEPNGQYLEDWYALKSYWSEKYGDKDNLHIYAELAFSRFLSADEISKAAKVRLVQGRMFYIEGYMENAIKYTQEAFDFALTAQDSVMMGWSIKHLSAVVSQTNKFKSADEYSLRGLQIAKNIGNRSLEACLLVDRAVLLFRKEKVDSAFQLFQVGLDLAREQEMEQFAALTVSNMSFLLMVSGREREALERLKKELIEREDERTLSTSMLTLTTAEVYMALGEPDEARSYIERGCSISEELEVAVGISSCKILWSQYHEATGNPEDALAYFKDYHSYTLKQTNEKVKRSLAVQDADRRVKDRDQEILDLKIQKRERAEDFERWLLTIIISCILFIIFVIGLFQLHQSRQKLKMTNQQRITAEARFSVLQAQMKPHFIFNAINGIQNLILKADTMKAYNYMSSFASLLRVITKSAANTSIELEAEVGLLKNYLDLEQMRFRKAFTYNFDIDENLLQENPRIPSMMIQPVVENSIIHGLSGMEANGLIDVSIQRDGDGGLLCVVTDNGRGRVAAGKIAENRGDMHLSIASVNSAERIKYLNDLGFKNAQVEIKDLYTNGCPSGTSVYISLPFIRKINTKYNGANTEYTVHNS